MRLILLFTACIHLAPRPNPFRAAAPESPTCAALSLKVARENIASVILGSFGISAAGASPSTDIVAAKWSLAGGGAALSAIAVGLGAAATSDAARYSKECP